MIVLKIKLAPLNGPINAAQIFFNWEVSTYYKGWDGKNIFQLMMLLDFMDAIKLAYVNKQLRGKITSDHLIESITKAYPNVIASPVPEPTY
jgi:hypothetical protein